MKLKIFTIILICIIIFCFIPSNSQSPNIIWEKLYKPGSLKELSFTYFDLDNDGSNLYLASTGRKSSLAKFDVVVYITDFEGNIINSYELPGIEYLKKIKKYGDSLFHYFYRINGELIKTDLQGNLYEHYKDSSQFSHHISQAEIFVNDSIYYLRNIYSEDSIRIAIYNKEFQNVRYFGFPYSSFTNNTGKTQTNAMHYFTGNSYIIWFIDYNINNTNFSKVDLDGSIIWQYNLNISDNIYFVAYDIKEYDDGSLLIYVKEELDVNNEKLTLIKLNKNGELIWKKTQDMGFKNDVVYYNTKLIINEVDGKDYIILYGTKKENNIRNYHIQIFDSMGEPIRSYTWASGGFIYYNLINGVTPKDNGNLIIFSRYDDEQLYLSEIEVDYSPETSVKDEHNINLLSIYPNPAMNNLRIKLAQNIRIGSKGIVYNYLGNIIDEFTLDDRIEYDYNTENLSNGLYFLKVENSDFYSQQSFLINR